ncbi:muconolactone Delta-isomerase [Rhodococcus sp. BP-349]|uniref:muconolactone Delta-isomerase n=1 Tax=unclassified Rhodococcus (in: high G+C Gram-positive bacteria) TaxID=192944 RepID=UPI001C9B3C43|nr:MULTISPECIES: muconolactone Delta-isomerase [unclassified Rhodococcus (in: high G+C Gram-positive bacteria)]MBY6537859.1 muconolactone Delta-isomerase [Rhodococcus sp. BP-363]MBY6542196.1 muconolactone Delta-isomerase [Rhodococcus sp. BP-369]MBY6561426.1 muconolactone Delta-isomerase [Rhodococcus sp. BP-370]MBY6575718.1 muconolactone Delta-isomerase [Rhodococcus sp. BP-364]MBY6585019.1 muconolactone Delta-isomerase [Rhodococcus sp. BP-358]
MLFAVKMHVALPQDLDADVRTDTLAREKAYSQQLQRDGEWVSIWRVVGEYSNLSVFDVRDNERLHEILWNLPLFSYMTIDVTPLATHPSAVTEG